MPKKELLISWESIFRILATGIGVYLLWHLRSVLLIILLSLMLSGALYPIVKFIHKKLPLSVASIIAVLVVFIPIIILIITFIASFIDQLPSILATLNAIIHRSDLIPGPLRSIDLTSYYKSTGDYLLRSTVQITGFITTLFTILFLSLYILIDSSHHKKMFLGFLPKEYRSKTEVLFGEVIRINGHYIRGNLIISLICGGVVTAGLLILGVPYAVPLGIFAGLVDLLPLIGAVIGAVPAVILGFAISPVTGLLTMLLFILYQQLENNVLAPNIYNKFLDISPTLSFVAVIVGGSLFGIVGAFIALPIAASIPTIIKYVNDELSITRPQTP